jgi:glycerol-3-phosphate dehydrogenase
MENFSKTFLEGKAKFRFQTEVLDIRRVKASENGEPSIWNVEVKDLQSGSTEILSFGRIILATGVRSCHVAADIVTEKIMRLQGMQ